MDRGDSQWPRSPSHTRLRALTPPHGRPSFPSCQRLRPTISPIQHRLLRHAIGTSVEERIYMGAMEYSVKELSEALEKIQMPCL